MGLQNFPEGAALVLPIKEQTGSRMKGFLYGMLSGAVEPIFAVVGILLATTITSIMPWALAFAAGAIASNIAKLAKKGGSDKGGGGNSGAEKNPLDNPKPTNKPGMDEFLDEANEEEKSEDNI